MSEKTKAIAIKTVECGSCQDEIYTCDECNCYFAPGDILHCTKNDKHYCECCFEEVE